MGNGPGKSPFNQVINWDEQEEAPGFFPKGLAGIQVVLEPCSRQNITKAMGYLLPLNTT